MDFSSIHIWFSSDSFFSALVVLSRVLVPHQVLSRVVSLSLYFFSVVTCFEYFSMLYIHSLFQTLSASPRPSAFLPFVFVFINECFLVFSILVQSGYVILLCAICWRKFHVLLWYVCIIRLLQTQTIQRAMRVIECVCIFVFSCLFSVSNTFVKLMTILKASSHRYKM